jgi:hypothetical protein
MPEMKVSGLPLKANYDETFLIAGERMTTWHCRRFPFYLAP